MLTGDIVYVKFLNNSVVKAHVGKVVSYRI